MSSNYTLNLKAVLDTSQVQNELNKIRVQQNQLNGSASQNPSSPQNISPAINPNLGSLGTTLSRINSTLVALNQTMQRLNSALLQQRPSNIPSAPSSPGGYVGGGRGSASSYNVLRYVMEMNNQNLFNNYKNNLNEVDKERIYRNAVQKTNEYFIRDLQGRANGGVRRFMEHYSNPEWTRKKFTPKFNEILASEYQLQYNQEVQKNLNAAVKEASDKEKKYERDNKHIQFSRKMMAAGFFGNLLEQGGGRALDTYFEDGGEGLRGNLGGSMAAGGYITGSALTSASTTAFAASTFGLSPLATGLMFGGTALIEVIKSLADLFVKEHERIEKLFLKANEAMQNANASLNRSEKDMGNDILEDRLKYLSRGRNSNYTSRSLADVRSSFNEVSDRLAVEQHRYDSIQRKYLDAIEKYRTESKLVFNSGDYSFEEQDAFANRMKDELDELSRQYEEERKINEKLISAKDHVYQMLEKLEQEERNRRASYFNDTEKLLESNRDKLQGFTFDSESMDARNFVNKLLGDKGVSASDKADTMTFSYQSYLLRWKQLMEESFGISKMIENPGEFNLRNSEIQNLMKRQGEIEKEAGQFQKLANIYLDGLGRIKVDDFRPDMSNVQSLGQYGFNMGETDSRLLIQHYYEKSLDFQEKIERNTNEIKENLTPVYS